MLSHQVVAYVENIVPIATYRKHCAERTTLPLLYYLPGRGGRTDIGLGVGLAERGLTVIGRETRGEFNRLAFDEQVEVISAELLDHWSASGRVVANSYGAYLFLHAQSRLEAFPGRVLLLSPIIGAFKDNETRRGFIPPRSEALLQLGRTGCFPNLKRCEIHVGSYDWQSDPESVKRFAIEIGADIHVAHGKGHTLGVEYVSGVLDRWLSL